MRLGQTITSCAFAIGQQTLPDGSTKCAYAGGSFEIYGAEGEYYNEDAQGNWNWQGTDGSKCSGSPAGGWYCSMASGQQYSGGDWTTSPASKSKSRAAAAKTATPAPTPAPAPSATTTSAPAAKPATPPQVPDPNDPIVDTSQPDSAGGITYTFQSGASYYETPDGAFTYVGADGYKQWGDAAGNVCDSYGYCWGPSYDQSGGGISAFFSNLGSTGQAVLIGGVVVVLALLLGGRRR